MVTFTMNGNSTAEWKRRNSLERWQSRLLHSLLMFLVAFQSAVSWADELGRGGRSSGSADEFPAFELPPLTTSGEESPRRPSVVPEPEEESPRRSPRPGTWSPRGSVLDNSIPLDPVDRDTLEEDLGPFRNSPFRNGRLSPTTPRTRQPKPPLKPPLRPTDDGLDELSNPLARKTADNGEFDWTRQPVSIADIDLGREWPFMHGKPNLTDDEADSYAALVQAVMDRGTVVPAQIPENMSVRSAWESAFYRFAEVRRMAWENGKLKLQLKSLDHPDPVTGAPKLISSNDRIQPALELKAYSLRFDMQAHPEEFVGRPVVLYGLFKPFGSVELRAKRTLEGEEQFFTVQRGELKNLQNTETIAIVDAMSYVDPQSQNVPLKAWPSEKRLAIPVMIKGWFVKLWGQQPLVFTDVARMMTPRPYDEYIRSEVRSRRPVSSDDSWLYHETLRQLQVTSSEVQAGIALNEQQAYSRQLLLDVRQKAAADRLSLDKKIQTGLITRNDSEKGEGFETLRKRLERQVAQREYRYQQYQKHPETFPTFVEVFQHPEHWQGRLVTLRGHVRRVTTYAGDSTLFDGQPLHELWLFTEDSQQNPAVIITPTLPKDFPASSDIIDSVTVTGCLFKMYVYRSQQENRLAPLLLAGHVSWTPTADQVVALATEGHIPSNSLLLAAARSQGRSTSDTLMLLLGFLALIGAMTVWGRVQRDRRERQRLMLLVDERPDFRQTSQDLFSGPFADPRIEPTRG